MLPGKRSQSRKAVVGITIVMIALAVTVLVFFAPNVAKLFQSSIRVVALMDDAAALRPGSIVWVAGREVGEVESVVFRGARTDSTERIAVTLRIAREYASHIRRDSEARITTARLIGRPVIDIGPGSETAPPVRDMDSLRVRSRGTLAGLLDKTKTLNESFDQLFTEMRAARAPAERRVRDLDRLERQLARSLEGMSELVAALDRSPIQTLSGPEWNRTLNSLSANGRELSSQLNAAVDRARTAHSDARPALERLANRADTISALMSDMKARVAQGGGGLLLRAQRDSAITAGLHEAQVQIDSLIAQTKRNPLRFWF